MRGLPWWLLAPLTLFCVLWIPATWRLLAILSSVSGNSQKSLRTTQSVSSESLSLRQQGLSSESAVSHEDALVSTSSIGFDDRPWHAMGLELEMQPLDGVDWAHNITRMFSIVRHAFEATPPCSGATPERQKQLHYVQLFKWERVQEKALPHWSIHEETDPGPLYELVAPWLGADAEAQTAVSTTSLLEKDFGGGRYAALHLHVDGHCLLSGVRLATLVLLWERYHGALAPLVAHRPSAATYGPAYGTKHPELLATLQAWWVAGEAAPPQDVEKKLSALFERHHDEMFEHAKAGLLASMPERDGYRNFAVNVCHLLQIRCCRKCDKNRAPKHGLVEFRIFDVVYGEKLRLLMQLVERMVQHSCAETVDPALRSHLLLPDTQPEENVTGLLDFLRIDKSAFLSSFHTKPTAPPRLSRFSQKSKGPKGTWRGGVKS